MYSKPQLIKLIEEHGSGGAVDSVNGKTGTVVLKAKDIKVNNSTSIQANLERIDLEVEGLIDDVSDLNEGKLDASKAAVSSVGGLVIPAATPTSDELVGIGTAHTQTRVSIGSGLTLHDNILSATGGPGTSDILVITTSLRDGSGYPTVTYSQLLSAYYDGFDSNKAVLLKVTNPGEDDEYFQVTTVAKSGSHIELTYVFGGEQCNIITGEFGEGDPIVTAVPYGGGGGGTEYSGSTTAGKKVTVDNTNHTISLTDTYAGGTNVTLNATGKGGSTASFYAPTSGGTAGYELVGNGTTSAPVWKQPSGYLTCSTAAGTVAKTVSCTNFKLATGVTCSVKFTNANTAANPTLNVGSTGAKAIYYNDAVASSSNSWSANEIVTFVYSGSSWYASAYSKKTPTIGNGTITINQGGVQKGTFTVNQSGNTTINLDGGGGGGSTVTMPTQTITGWSIDETSVGPGEFKLGLSKTLTTQEKAYFQQYSHINLTFTVNLTLPDGSDINCSIPIFIPSGPAVNDNPHYPFIYANTSANGFIKGTGVLEMSYQYPDYTDLRLTFVFGELDPDSGGDYTINTASLYCQAIDIQ